MGPMNPRMNPPRGPGMGPMGAGTYGPGMRGPPPNSSLGPGGMPPMGMAGGRPQWQPNTSSVSYLCALFNATSTFNELVCILAHELFILVTWKLRWSTRAKRTARSRNAHHAITSRFIQLRRREHVHTNEARK